MSQSQHWQSNPVIANMSPEKIAFLMEIMQELQGKSMEEALPLIISANAKAGKKGISYTSEEMDVLITCFSAQLSPSEQKRISHMQKMLHLYQQSQ